MSHWIKTKTKMVEKKYIMDGLAAMGIKVTENEKIRAAYSSRSSTEDVDIKINEGVGLRQQKDGSWELVGDFYGTNMSRYYGRDNQFIEELQGKYCVAQAKDKIANLGGGWVITDNENAEIDQNGYIVMRARNFTG